MLRKMIVALAAGLCTLPAAAQNAGPYVGLSAGQSQARESCKDLAAGVSCDNKATTVKLFGGYQFNPNFAAELGYSDNLSEARATTGGATATVKVSAWELVGVPAIPLGEQFSLLGKVGLYYANTKGRTNLGVSADETNTGLTWGFGFGFNFTRNLGFRAEWQRYVKVGGSDTGEDDVDALNIGALWRF